MILVLQHTSWIFRLQFDNFQVVVAQMMILFWCGTFLMLMNLMRQKQLINMLLKKATKSIGPIKKNNGHVWMFSLIHSICNSNISCVLHFWNIYKSYCIHVHTHVVVIIFSFKVWWFQFCWVLTPFVISMLY